MIKVSDLAFSYGKKRVLNNINLELKPGFIYGLLGENGVGKTTLLTLLAGLKKTEEGSIDVDGYKPFDRKPGFLSNVYFLCDEPSGVNMTAYDYAKNYGGFWEGFDLELFTKILSEFEVSPELKMNKMSCGQLKKTYISFALSTKVKYLLMDEPTNGLDIPSKSQFRKAISKYTSDDTCIVISTHQVRDLENIIDPIIILDKQDVLLNASTEEISQKLFFYYGNEVQENALYSEMIPGGNIQVSINTSNTESKVNIEALFNAILTHKELIKTLFTTE